MGLKATLEQVQIAGLTDAVTTTPLEIIRGSEVYCRCSIKHSDDSPAAIYNYTVKMKLRKADGTILELTSIPFDNGNGKVDFILYAADTSLLMLSEKNKPQNVELICEKTATPTTKTFIPILSAVIIKDPTII